MPIQKRRLALVEELESRITPALTFSEFMDPHPAPGNQFGATVVPLSTGNVVITSPFDDAGGTNSGAVYLFNGTTGDLISTLTGSYENDQIGNGGVTALTNGNYVVRSWYSDNGEAVDAGAVTFGNGTTGISGIVSAANSLVGSTTNDYVGVGSGGSRVTALSNGNYVIGSPNWNNGAADRAGAVTFGSGTTGISGIVSAANSLIGSSTADLVGIYVTALSNGNYVVRSPDWHNGAAVDVGAVTFGNGSTGISGIVGAANSLVGSTRGQFRGVTALSNGNYVVSSPLWNNGAAIWAGAVTFANGTTGIIGAVSAANSLVGSRTFDQVGSLGVTPLTNGNYVVSSPLWKNGSVARAGAVTLGSGTDGISGVVSAANSLVGTRTNDQISWGGMGNNGVYYTGVTALRNGNYIVSSSIWDNGNAIDAGSCPFYAHGKAA